jgi:hypothetical protein
MVSFYTSTRVQPTHISTFFCPGYAKVTYLRQKQQSLLATPKRLVLSCSRWIGDGIVFITKRCKLREKVGKWTYFSSLGEANANRREGLPPSQGGKYQGFGSTPASSYSRPSYGSSSANLPTLEELQTQPVAALSKGWSLLSAAVTAASKVVAEKAMDPALHESVKGYAA